MRSFLGCGCCLRIADGKTLGLASDCNHTEIVYPILLLCYHMTTTRLLCFFLFVPLGWFWLGTSEWKIAFTRRKLSSPHCYWAITSSRSEVNGTRFIMCEFRIYG